MKRLVLIAALSLLSITAASSMDNGESDKFNSFDFVVKIKKQVSKTTKKSIINTTKGKYIRTSTRTSFSTCSAVVIDSNIILTAAHCCYDRGGEFVHKSDYGINTGQGAYQSNNLTCTVPVEYSRLYRDNTDFYEKRKKLSLPDAAELSKIPANQVLSIKSVAYDVGVMISKKPISVKHRVRLIFNDPIFSLIVNDREYSNEVKSNSFANRMLIKSVEFFKKYENYKPVLIGMGSHDCKLLPNKMFDKTTCKQSEQRKWKEVKIYTNKDNLGGSLRHLGDDQFIMLLIAYLDDKSIIGAPGDSGGALVLVDPSGVNSPILIGIVSGGTSTTGNFSSLLMNGHLVDQI